MHMPRRRGLGVSGLMMALMGAAGMGFVIPPKLTGAAEKKADLSTPGRRYGSRGRNYPRQSARQAARYAAISGLTVFRQDDKPKANATGDIWILARAPWSYQRAEGSRKTWKAVA